MNEERKTSSPAECPYIDVLSDWGFKRMFGEEQHKKFMIDFLNAVLPQKRIKDIAYRKTEYKGLFKGEKSVIFDVACKSDTGEEFIVEMQRDRMEHFAERVLYYVTFLVQRLHAGEPSYDLPRIRSVSVLGFVMLGNDDRVTHRFLLKEELDGGTMTDVLHFSFIELPKFQKGLKELDSDLDEWCYVLKNIHTMDSCPEELGERFGDFFSSALVANLSREEFAKYEEAMKNERDEMARLETAHKDGVAEGMEKGMKQGIEQGLEKGMRKGREKERLRMLRNMLRNGIEDRVIQMSIDVSAEELAGMKQAIVG